MDMSQYKDLFLTETREHIRTMNEHIVALEKDANDRELIDSLFRLAHSIKGMAASMGYDFIANLAHKMEDLMARVRREEISFTAPVADLLLEAVDKLFMMLEDVERDVSDIRDVSPLIRKLAGFPLDEDRASDQQPDDMASGALSSAQQVLQENQCEQEAGSPYREVRTIRVKTEVLDNLINITGELITNKHRLKMIGEGLGSAPLDEALVDLTKLMRELHNEVLKVRLQSFATIADQFPRLVRDLARKSGKEVNLEIIGREVELDRAIVEELADPLLHLLRNAVDHGLESCSERLAACKATTGEIRLMVSREKDQVVLKVEDDGRGMDPARLIDLAIERKLVEPENRHRISPQEAFLLTCLPGFSTAREVTDISGRGVGMDVVRTCVQSLGGNLSIDSEVGYGSRITIKLPLTIAIIQILLVNCAGLTVGLPVVKVLHTLDLKRSRITGSGKRKVFYLDEEELPLLSLNRLLGLPLGGMAGDYIPIVVAELKGRKVGLAVDGFESQMEVFMKPLGRPLDKLRGAAGGTVLGDGRVVVIVDMAGLC